MTLGISRQSWRLLIVTEILAVLRATIVVFIPVILKFVLDTGLLAKDRSAFALGFALLMGATVLVGVLAYISALVGNKAVLQMIQELRDRFSLPLTERAGSTRSDHIGLLRQLESSLVGDLRTTLLSVPYLSLTLFGALLLLLFIHPTFALVVTGFAAFVLIMFTVQNFVQKGLTIKTQQTSGEQTDFLRHIFSRPMHLAWARAEAFVINGYTRHALKMLRIETLQDLVNGISYAISQGLAPIGLGLILLLMANSDSIAAGTVFLLFYTIVRALNASADLAQVIPSVVQVTNIWIQLKAVDQLQSNGEQGSLGDISGKKVALEIRNLSFSYPQNNKKVLKNISLNLRVGESIAVLGPSGCGKSTLMNVLLKNLSPFEGDVLAFGQDFRSLAANKWFDLIALVPQDTPLISGSLLENIRLYRKNIRDTDIEKTIDRLTLRGFVNRFPQGLSTQITPASPEMTKMNRQILGLLRAECGLAQLLFMDEPLGALPAGEAAEVEGILASVIKSRTVFMITHESRYANLCTQTLQL